MSSTRVGLGIGLPGPAVAETWLTPGRDPVGCAVTLDSPARELEPVGDLEVGASVTRQCRDYFNAFCWSE